MAIVDEVSLLLVGVYIDLSPVAAGIADVPQTSEYTSIATRVEHVETKGQTDRLEAAAQGSMAGWQLRMEKLRKGRLCGHILAASQEKSQEVAAHLGVRRVANLAGCPAS